MSIPKYDCTTMYDAPEPYAIMVQETDGSYVSADDYEALKDAAAAFLAAVNRGVRNSTAEVNAKHNLMKLLGIATNAVHEDEDDDHITINMKPFDGTEGSCDSLYNNSSYDDSFRFQTKYGTTHTGNIGWEQGWGNNYRFYVGSDGNSHWYSPSEVSHIEVK